MTHSVHIDLIQISPDRQRREFDPEALTDLSNSIMAHGLMHPIVCRDTPIGLILVAGERRLRAIRDIMAMGERLRCNGSVLPPMMCSYVTLGELSPLAAEEAELDENLKRKDLTWQEQSAAIARLHVLRSKQAELIGQAHAPIDTAKEVYPDGQPNWSQTLVRRDIILSEHLSNPEVAKAKSPEEAIKILKKAEARKKHQDLAERVGKNFNSSAHKLFHVDCLDWLKTCQPSTFDVILTDPPYGMDADEFGDGAGKMVNSEHHYKDTQETFANLMNEFCPLIFAAAKPQAHAYIFCDIDNFHRLKLYMQEAGWYVFRTPFICHKPRSGRVPLPEHGPRRQYELILYAIKGWKPVTGIYTDVISTILEENLTHGAQKPVELYIDLLRRSIMPGDTVLDAFAGTGTIFPAAHALKVRAVGLEISPEYYGIAVNRLNALDTEPEFL